MERYRSGHNGADSKFRQKLGISSPWFSLIFLNTENLKIEYFLPSLLFSLQRIFEQFFGRKPDENRHGELSEWSKVQHSKSCRSLSGVTSQTLDTSGFFRFSTLFQNWISTVFLRFVYDFYTWFSISRKPAKPWKYSMEMYRSGRNEADSKSCRPYLRLTPQPIDFTGIPVYLRFWKIEYLRFF